MLQRVEERGNGNGNKTLSLLVVLFLLASSSLARHCSSSVRLLLLPVHRVEPGDLFPVVEALEVVVTEGLALARVVGVADALLVEERGGGGREREREKAGRGF